MLLNVSMVIIFMFLFVLFFWLVRCSMGVPQQALGDTALALFKISTGCYYSCYAYAKWCTKPCVLPRNPLYDVLLGHAAVAACLYDSNRVVVGWQ